MGDKNLTRRRVYESALHQRKKDNPHYQRVKADHRLRVRYGITLAEYEQAVKDQDGCCPLCGKKKKLVVDHDHETKLVRGFICQGCNVKLAALEDADWLERALVWIREM